MVALATVAIAGIAGAASAQKHPWYDDQGTLAWHTKFADAKIAARSANKLILVEIGAKT